MLYTPKEKKIKEVILQHPTYSTREIAKIVGYSHVTVNKFKNKYMLDIDTDFIQYTAGKFISAFGEAADYWKLQIDKLEALKEEFRELLDKPKIIFKKTAEGNSFPEEVDLDPRDKATILANIASVERQQSQLRKDILYLASQGEAIEVIKLMRSGKLSSLT